MTPLPDPIPTVLYINLTGLELTELCDLLKTPCYGNSRITGLKDNRNSQNPSTWLATLYTTQPEAKQANLPI